MRTEDFSDIVERALWEDLRERGDITSQAVVPVESSARGEIVVRAPGVVAGLAVADYVFARIDPDCEFEELVDDGTHMKAGTVAASVAGPSRSILTAERTALNLMGRMSGVATATAALVAEVEGTGARITDTRKTMPGLRAIDKHAVVLGGGVNHRMGLYDEVMIKDNHIVAAGDFGAAVVAARAVNGDGVRVTVEVEDLHQLAEVLETNADRVLLDNMDTLTLRGAVEMVNGSLETEASGNVTLETARAIAETGVDFISVGWITHSAPQLDIALDFVS
jgi:nicotinate-nucleotide pyrophosphorylase (carboxylating)